MSEMTADTPRAPKPFEIPQRWLTFAAAVILLTIMGAVALSVGIWMKDGQPAVAATFGARGGFRGGPGGGGPGGQRGGPGQGGFQPGGAQPGQTFPGQGALPPGQNGQQGPRTQPGGNTPPNQGTFPNSALSRTPDLTGILQAASTGSITVRTFQNAQNPTVVSLTDETIVYRADGSRGTLSDLQNGRSVAVVTARGTTPLTAVEVQLIGR